MSTRIIIENDGERYACEGLTIEIHNKSIICVSDGIECAMASYVKMPPVERTDNSEVIANLEDENAKLRDEILKVIAARNELLDLNRDCCDENEKMREALKPIMACDMSVETTLFHGHAVSYTNAFKAVRKAQSIMKGGAE